MRKDQCKFCTSRKCYERIVTPDMSFDEVSCHRHSKDLTYHANVVLKGASRWNISSTGTMRRGERFEDNAHQPLAVDGATPEGFCKCGTSIEHHTGMGCLYRPAL